MPLRIETITRFEDHLCTALGLLLLTSLVGCAPVHHRHAELAGPPGPPGPPGPAGTPYATTPVFADAWSGVAAGAAAGYCLAKHPYLSNTSDPYTADGYEKAGVPGIVGAIRRNFVRDRTTLTTDAGLLQTCAQACREFGKGYEPSYRGKVLHQRLADGTLITSGQGDLALGATTDFDFYLGRTNVVGVGSRANRFHEEDVAQADFCCCHVTTP